MASLVEYELEAVESLRFGFDLILKKFSIRKILYASYEAGGLYPTLLGYAIGGVFAAIVIFCTHKWLRALYLGLTGIFVWQAYMDFEDAFMILFCCGLFFGSGLTYVQIASWRDAFAMIAYKREQAKLRVQKEE